MEEIKNIKIKELKNQNERIAKLNDKIIKEHTSYKKNGFYYEITIFENSNVIEIIKQDIKTDFFQVSFFEVI